MSLAPCPLLHAVTAEVFSLCLTWSVKTVVANRAGRACRFWSCLTWLELTQASGPPLLYTLAEARGYEACNVFVSFLFAHTPCCCLWQALDEHQRQVELKREARLKEIQEKQRIREERARRARERVSCVPFYLDEVGMEGDHEVRQKCM